MALNTKLEFVLASFGSGRRKRVYTHLYQGCYFTINRILMGLWCFHFLTNIFPEHPADSTYNLYIPLKLIIVAILFLALFSDIWLFTDTIPVTRYRYWLEKQGQIHIGTGLAPD